VRAAIDELGFRPSHAARTLLSGNSKMIGVYIPVLSGTFYTPILQIIDTELRAAGLHMVVAFGAGLGGRASRPSRAWPSWSSAAATA
jgi:LacI family transcriptional regulator